MLQPKRTKFRKQMKGRNRGLAIRGSTVAFGEFGLKATERGRLTARQSRHQPGREGRGSAFSPRALRARPRDLQLAR